MKRIQSLLSTLNILCLCSSIGVAASMDQQVLQMSSHNECRVTNAPIGGDDVPACEGYASSKAKIRGMQFYSGWYPPGTKDSYVIQGLGLRWDDGKVKWWGPKQYPQNSLDLANDEKITSFIVGGGSLFDWVKVNTSKGHSLSAGGSGGGAHEMKLGNGEMVGWEGFCAPNLVAAFAPTFGCKE